MEVSIYKIYTRPSKTLKIVDPDTGKNVLEKIEKPEIINSPPFVYIIPSLNIKEKHETKKKEKKIIFQIKKEEFIYEVIDFGIFPTQNQPKEVVCSIQNFSQNCAKLVIMERPNSLKDILKIRFRQCETDILALDKNSKDEFKFCINCSQPIIISDIINIKIKERKYPLKIKAIIIDSKDYRSLNPYATSFIPSEIKQSWNKTSLKNLETKPPPKPWDFSDIKDYCSTEKSYENLEKDNYIALFTNLLHQVGFI